MPTETYTKETMPRRKKSEETRDHDGRKHNKRLPPKVQLDGSPTSRPPALNNAKKAAVRKYAINALKEVFGSEQEAMIHFAQQAKETGNVAAWKLILEYSYNKPENIDNGPTQTKITAPVINFNYNSTLDVHEDTIDIEAEDISSDDE